MMLSSKLHTLAWFAKRPTLWGQAFVLAKYKFLPNRDTQAHRTRATKWCRARVTNLEGLSDAVGWPAPSSFQDSVGDDVVTEARQVAAKVPGEMGGPGDLDLLYHTVRCVNATRVVETGVAYGWSSLAILAALDANGRGRLVSIDMPYVKGGKEDWVGVVVPPRLRSSWELIRRADRQGLPLALASFSGEIDVCHYDSDKSYWGRRWAYPILWNALRPGGVFISDDIQDNEAFIEFTKSINVAPYVLSYEGKFIGVIPKP